MTSNKILNLLKISDVLNVPLFIYLDDNYFSEAFVNYKEVNQTIEKKLLQMRFTLASSITEDIQYILAAADNLIWREDFQDHLLNLFPQFATEILHAELAIRSAANSEDAREKSLAGVFLSILHVKGQDSIKESILQVWKSYWSPAAVVERLRRDELNNGKRMNVMIQSMVTPIFSGVAFSLDPVTHVKDAVIEFVEGTCDQLVSGDREGRIIRENEYDPNSNFLFLREVFKVVHDLTDLLKEEIDIEWAWDAHNILYILQVRAITTIENTENAIFRGPIFSYQDLYFSDSHDIKSFGSLPDFALYFRNKRGPLQLFSKRMGLQSPNALVVTYNKKGLDNLEVYAGCVSKFNFPKVVIDAGRTLRQLIIDFGELDNVLIYLAGCNENETRTVIIRDFISGDFGFISRVDDLGKVFCEGTFDGLLALNRGTAESSIIFSETSTGAYDAGFSLEQTKQIARCTKEAQIVFGSVQLEWVRYASNLYLIDYSKIKSRDIGVSESIKKNLVINRGYAAGNLLKVPHTVNLKSYSEAAAVSVNDVPKFEDLNFELKNIITLAAEYEHPPLVLTDKPYAALAAIVPFVAGFIFRTGSLLCHLAIIIRENRLPAIVSENLYYALLHEKSYELDLYEIPADSPQI